MRIRRLAGISIVAAMAFSSLGAVAQESPEGAWVLEQTEDLAGNVEPEPLRALVIFTQNHYSIMLETGDVTQRG